MSGEPEMSDSQFTNVFSIMIGGLILLTIALIILAVIIGSGVNQSDINAQSRENQVAERIAPVGQITVGEVASSQAAASGSGEAGESEVASGEAVYQNNCAACHANGAAGAPMFGDAAAWSDRVDKGVDTLYTNAIQGFQGDTGMMPPKGGATDLSDEAVKAAVDHMVDAASGTTEPDAAEPDAAEPDAAEPDAAGAEETQVASGESVYQSSCMACHASGVAGAPELGDTDSWSGRIDKGVDTLYTNAIQGFQGDTGMMPPKGGDTSLSDEAVRAAVDYMVERAE